MSTWLGYETLRHLVKHYSECLWRCFWIRVTFESIEWVKKIALCPYCGWASSDQLKTWTKPKGWVRGSSSCPTCWPGTLVFPGFWTQMKTLTLLGSWACWTSDWNLAFLVPRFPDSNWDYTSALLGLQLANCRSWSFRSHNLMSQFLIINLLIDSYSYCYRWIHKDISLLVLFLRRTLIQVVFIISRSWFTFFFDHIIWYR